MVRTFKVDLDYEASLFDSHYQELAPANQKTIREFEYVFFLVQKNKSILKNIRSYDKKYLEKLQALGFVIPQLKPDAPLYDYWWGHHHDKELEKTLNSKLTSAEMAKAFRWGFQEGAIVGNLQELKDHIGRFPLKEKWIIKRAHSFSGIGHYQFNRHSMDEDVLTKILNEKILLEPVYERLFDIGTTLVVENGILKRSFMVENFNSKAGGFKGGVGCSQVDKFKKYIHEKYSYSLDELEKITLSIGEKYLALGAKSNIQIDSFVYLESGELKLYPLVEVNYRKTMGLVIQALADHYPEAQRLEWKIESAKTLKSNPVGEDWIKISPEGNHFQSFFKPIYFS